MLKNIIDQILDFFCTKVYKWWANKKHENLLNALKLDLKIYELLEGLLKDVDCDRINFIYMHNGGGSIVPGKTKFISVILEKTKDSSIPSRKDDFQRVVVGDRYLVSVINMLFEESHMVIKKTEDLPKRSKLRDVYELDGIQNSIIAYIASNPDSIWYMSMNFKRDVSITSPLRDKVNICRSKIANILEQYFTLTHRI